MKLFFVILVSALTLSATDPQAKKKPAAPAKAAEKVVDGSKTIAIPPEAVLQPDGDYQYTDAAGKKWIYRRTPFGVARLEDTPEAAGKGAVDTGAGIKATEDGDVVRFERLGPFGMWKWEKKKSELDAGEKAALERSRANSKTESKTASKQD